MPDYLPQTGLFSREPQQQPALTGRGGVTTVARMRQLAALDKRTLAAIHMNNGGLMGLAAYLKWSKDELISAILEDEEGPADGGPPPLNGCTCGQWDQPHGGAHRGSCPWGTEGAPCTSPTTRPAPMPLDGCTCGGIGTSGAHHRSCPWGE